MNTFERVFVTGGCGYTGSVLVGELLRLGKSVSVWDTQWFGNRLEPHKNLTVIKGDVRDLEQDQLVGFDAIVHLANIANDPSVELNPTLSWEVNVLATMQLAEMAKRVGVGQFIFASSGSVYGVSDKARVTEDLPLLPISVYNKTKMVAERVLLSYADSMQVHCIRPATVCGLSPRMRLDVSVNMFVKQAFVDRKMTVFGGNQTRPNIHIDDLIGVYSHFLSNPNLKSGCYNAGFENISILEIAQLVARRIDAEILIRESNDPRSYRQDSTKLLETGFTPKMSVSHAVTEMVQAWKDGKIVESPECYTVRRMIDLGLSGTGR